MDRMTWQAKKKLYMIYFGSWTQHAQAETVDCFVDQGLSATNFGWNIPPLLTAI